jgi:hypothetical protein
MAFNLSNPIGTGTDAELLEFTRAAIAQVTLHGQAYGMDGRTLTRADLGSLREQLVFFESRVNQSAGRSRDNVASLQRAS